MNTKRLIDRITKLSEKDAELLEERKTRLLAAKIFQYLPQGPGSGLNADLLDGFHAKELLSKVDDMLKKLSPKVGSAARGMVKHGNEWHDPAFEPLGVSLLLDGSRKMTGKLHALDAIFDLPNSSLEIKEHEFSGVGMKAALLTFTDSFATQFGAMSGGLFLTDILGQDQVIIYMADALSDNYGYLLYTPSTGVLEFLFFDNVKIPTFEVSTSLNISGKIASHGIPASDNTYDLGSKTGPIFLWKRWRHGFFSGDVDAGQFKVAGVSGVDGSFATADGKTVTVSKGLITSIA